MKIGDIVQLNPTYAKWHLDHPDIYFSRDGTKKQWKIFNDCIRLHLTCCLGEPIYGKVVNQGCNDKTWGVFWKVGEFSEFFYVNKRHIIG